MKKNFQLTRTPLEPKQQLLAWLDDAHAMECALQEVLERHIRDAAELPRVQARLQQHLTDTKWHASLLRECIELSGGAVSAAKPMVAGFAARLQSMSTGVFRDQVLKNLLMDSSAEHFEVACYTSLIAAAEHIGETDIASICRGILQQDADMAEWLDSEISSATVHYFDSTFAQAEAV